MASDDQLPKPGFGKNGKAYKTGNTREDGSYGIGKYRTPAASKFQVGDGKKRGPRPAGVKNLATEYNEELKQKITVKEGNVRKKITKRRSLIKRHIERGMQNSDRAAEVAFKFMEAAEKRGATLQADDLDVIEGFLASLLSTGDSYDEPPASDLRIQDRGEGDGVSGDA